MRPLVALALLVGLAPAAPVPKDLKKKQDDKALLVGTWKPLGNRTEWFRFEENGQMRVWNTGGSAESGVPYSWSIDPDADPKQMTWGPAKGAGMPQWDCVYELDGDVLKIVYATAGKRPAKVEAAGGTFFCDLRREPPAK